MLASVFLAAANHLLAQSGWARQRLHRHAGSSARLAIEPLFAVDFSISADGFFAEWSAAEEEPEVTLRLPAAQLPMIALDGIAAAMSKLHLEGNADFAETLGFVFRHLRWDAEEDLSRVVGDIGAHRLLRLGRAVHAGGQESMQRTAANMAEYFSEEAGLLVSRQALPAHAQELIELRDAIGRLDQRLKRVTRQLAQKDS